MLLSERSANHRNVISMRMKTWILLFALLLGACNYPSTRTAQTTPSQPSPVVATRSAPVISPTPAQMLYLPALPNAASPQTGDCTRHAASMDIAAPGTELHVGDSLTITLTLVNTGCAMLGLPQYYLDTGADAPDGIFDPPSPEPILHSLGIDPGSSDSAAFTLLAARPGEATLAGSASFEVHLGYPGPAYWATAASQQLILRISP